MSTIPFSQACELRLAPWAALPPVRATFFRKVSPVSQGNKRVQVLISKYALPTFCALMLVVGSAPSHAEAVGEAHSICSLRDFDRYIDAFANDVSVQQAHTKVPLRSTILIDGDPEPQVQARWLSRSQIRFPLMPTLAQQRGLGLLRRTDSSASRVRSVLLVGTDTGYRIEYRFEYVSACWTLVGVNDQSL